MGLPLKAHNGLGSLVLFRAGFIARLEEDGGLPPVFPSRMRTNLKILNGGVMIPGERLIIIANQIYECRRKIKSLFGSEWKVKLFPFKSTIAARMQADAINEVAAAIRLAAEARPNVELSMCYMAAAVEMVEPE